MKGFKVVNEYLNNEATKMIICKWTNRTKEQVEALPYEQFVKEAIVATMLEAKRGI